MPYRYHHHWDIKTYPAIKKHGKSNAARLIIGHRAKLRRITIEVVRIRNGIKQKHLQDTSGSSPTTRQLGDEDQVLVRILTPKRKGLVQFHRSVAVAASNGSSKVAYDHHDDDHADNDDVDDDDDEHRTRTDDDPDWKLYRVFHLATIDRERTHQNKFSAQFGVGAQQEFRRIKFCDAMEVEEFSAIVEKYRKLLKERSNRKKATFRQSVQRVRDDPPSRMKQSQQQHQQHGSDEKRSLLRHHQHNHHYYVDEDDEDEFYNVSLLIEIVSAMNLPISDLSSTDPYVSVFLGKQLMHKTKEVKKTIDPIWTLETNSLFLVHTPIDTFFDAADGLKFIIKDHDSIRANDVIAKASVPHETLLKAKGERMELILDKEWGKMKKSKKTNHYHDSRRTEDDDIVNFLSSISSRLVLRVRRATTHDIQFMKQLQEHLPPSGTVNAAVRKFKDNFGAYSDLAVLQPQTHPLHGLNRSSKAGPGPRRAGVTRKRVYRVKPGPDPNQHDDETKWMTGEQLRTEALKPSTAWVESGSGGLGYLYVEVIGCQNLANMDQSIGTKSDAFACIIYEDAIVNTDVINNELSPLWMPWTQRAFKLHIAHPSSQLFIGVFDYDSAATTAGILDNHDAIGRTTIDVTNLYPGMEYMLYYNLYQSTIDEKRKVRGVIQVRVQIEWNGRRKPLMASLGPPPLNHLNVKEAKNFRKAFYVTHGKDNPNEFKLSLLQGYLEEITELWFVIAYIVIEAVKVVLLWRGTLPMCGIKIPIHSITAFVMGVLLVENYNLLPSCIIYCVAWLFLATMDARQHHPSPWAKTRTFLPFWGSFFSGKALIPDIVENENKDKVLAFRETIEEMRKRKEKMGEEMMEHAEKINAEYFDQEDERKRTDIETKLTAKFSSFNVLKPFLFPLQLLLHEVVLGIRIVKSILIWDESYYAILITTACLVTATSIIWVPWAFIMRWTLRIIVWVFLGPWMKIVDIYIVRPIENQTPEETLRKRTGAGLATATAQNRRAMIRKEEAFKLRAMKKYMFGKYILRVPRFREYRLRDVPNINSSASHRKSGRRSNLNNVNVVQHRRGQHLLSGHMIPVWGDETRTTFHGNSN